MARTVPKIKLRQLEMKYDDGWCTIVLAGTDVAILRGMPLTKSEALKTAQWLEALTDWSRPVDELNADEALAKQVVDREAAILDAYYRRPLTGF